MNLWVWCVTLLCHANTLLICTFLYVLLYLLVPSLFSSSYTKIKLHSALFYLMWLVQTSCSFRCTGHLPINLSISNWTTSHLMVLKGRHLHRGKNHCYLCERYSLVYISDCTRLMSAHIGEFNEIWTTWKLKII